MKKLESTWYNMVIVLTLIAVCAGAALAYVNHLTEGPIKEIAEANEAAAIKAVLCTDDVVITDTITIGEGKDAATVYLCLLANQFAAVYADEEDGYATPENLDMPHCLMNGRYPLHTDAPENH